jgi:hypothetical protein
LKVHYISLPTALGTNHHFYIGIGMLSEFQKKRYSTPKHYYQTAKQYSVLAICLATKNTIGFDTPNTATISFGNIVLSTVQIYGI